MFTFQLAGSVVVGVAGEPAIRAESTDFAGESVLTKGESGDAASESAREAVSVVQPNMTAAATRNFTGRNTAPFCSEKPSLTAKRGPRPPTPDCGLGTSDGPAFLTADNAECGVRTVRNRDFGRTCVADC